MNNFDHLKAKLDAVTDSPDATVEPSQFEKIFDLPAGSTPEFADSLPEVRVGELMDPSTGEIIAQPVSDVTLEIIKKEERIEELQISAKTEEIYNASMAAFQNHIALTNSDPKFAARNGEVAAQFLNIALASVNSKVEAKFKRAKMRYAEHSAANPSTQNNLIVADRNDVLAALFNKDKDFGKQTIVETIENDLKK